MFTKEIGEFLSLGQEPTPYIPKEFPRELLPDDICDKELLYFSHCTKLYDTINGCP